MTILGFDNQEFIKALADFSSPAEPIEHIKHLKGRDEKLRELEQYYYTGGAQIVICGERGVGKTSLAKSSLEKLENKKHIFIECKPDHNFLYFLNKLIIELGLEKLSSQVKKILSSLNKFRFDVKSDGIGVEVGRTTDDEKNNSTAYQLLIDSILRHSKDEFDNSSPVCIVLDEFQNVQDEEFKKNLSWLIKEISNLRAPIKFIICGVANTPDDLIGADLAIHRQIARIELQELNYTEREKVLLDILGNFNVFIDEHSITRISQVSDGYPFYIRQIGCNLLWELHHDKKTVSSVNIEHFTSALHKVSKHVEKEIVDQYDTLANNREKDDAKHVLWAIAHGKSTHGMHLDEIVKNYNWVLDRLGVSFRSEQRLDDDKVKAIVSKLKRDSDGAFIERYRAKHYKFTEARARGYVRLKALLAGVDFNPDHPYPESIPVPKEA